MLVRSNDRHTRPLDVLPGPVRPSDEPLPEPPSLDRAAWIARDSGWVNGADPTEPPRAGRPNDHGIGDDDEGLGDGDGDTGTVTVTRTGRKLKKPSLYKVLFHNDDYTTREFVVYVLRTIFHHTEDEAVRIMWHVHTNGVGLAGVYTYEIAETKARKTEALARENQYPLRVTVEPE